MGVLDFSFLDRFVLPPYGRLQAFFFFLSTLSGLIKECDSVLIA